MPKRTKTDVAVRNVQTPGRYSAGETLYLMVWPNGSKSWVQRLTIEGRRTDLGLGAYPTVTLKEARQKARENRSLTKSGGNPLAVKQGEAMLAEIPTFESLARKHIAENLDSWKNAKHRAQWLSTLETYGCSEQSASGWAELTGVVLGALNCLMAPWWGLFSAYNRP